MNADLTFLGDATSIRAQGVYLGERLDLRGTRRFTFLARDPVTIRSGQAGFAVLFRYGVAVLFNLEGGERESFLSRLGPLVAGPFEAPEEEPLTVRIGPGTEGRLDESGTLWLEKATVGRFQVVAEVLSRSIVLAHYESQVAQAFERLEPLAKRMSRGHRPRGNPRELLTRLGEALLAQARTVGRVETSDKPELTWDDPALDRLYTHLAWEYELVDRDRALTRKTAMISDTTGVFMDLIQARQTIRVEWYIVILILVEIVIILYDLARGG